MFELHFIRPYWFFALIPWAVVTLSLFFNYRTNNSWSRVVDPHLYKHLLSKQLKARQLAIPTLISLFGLLLILILSGPSNKQIVLPAYQSEDPLVVAFDLSNKILASDIKPSRLERGQFKLKDLLKIRKEGQTGLVAFSGNAFVASPLSVDANTLNGMVEELSPDILPVSGQSIANALQKSADLIKQAGFSEGRIIVITTGPATSADLRTAKKLANNSIYTSVLGVGTKLGAPVPETTNAYSNRVELSKLDELSLKDLAQAGKGRYHTISLDNQDLDSLLKKDLNFSKSNQADGIALKKWADNSRLLLIFILPFALYAFRRGFLESYLK